MSHELFQELVEQKSADVFIVHVTWTSAAATAQNVAEFCEYVGLLRRLPGEFEFFIDLTRANLLSLIPFVRTIFNEASQKGMSRCRRACAKIPRHLHALSQILEVVNLFQSLTVVEMCS